MVAAETVTLSLGTVGMLLGVMIWYRLWTDSSDEIRKRGAFAWIVLIPGAAAVAYTLMASNVGYISVGGVDVPMLRYIDWIVTTPVLIGYVAYTAGTTRRTISLIVAVDAAMIAIGWVGVVTTGMARLVAFVASSACYVGLLYILYGILPTVAAEQSGSRRRLFEALQNHVGLLWVAYPVIWASGPLGLGYIEAFGVTLLITFTDVMAKTPYVYFVSVHRSAFDESSSTAAGKPTNTSVRTPAATDDDGRTAD